MTRPGWDHQLQTFPDLYFRLAYGIQERSSTSLNLPLLKPETLADCHDFSLQISLDVLGEDLHPISKLNLCVSQKLDLLFLNTVDGPAPRYRVRGFISSIEIGQPDVVERMNAVHGFDAGLGLYLKHPAAAFVFSVFKLGTPPTDFRRKNLSHRNLNSFLFPVPKVPGNGGYTSHDENNQTDSQRHRRVHKRASLTCIGHTCFCCATVIIRAYRIVLPCSPRRRAQVRLRGALRPLATVTIPEAGSVAARPSSACADWILSKLKPSCCCQPTPPAMLTKERSGNNAFRDPIRFGLDLGWSATASFSPGSCPGSSNRPSLLSHRDRSCWQRRRFSTRWRPPGTRCIGSAA